MGQLNSFVTLPVSHHTCLFSQYTPPFREGLGVGFPFFVVHRGVEPRFSEPKSGVPFGHLRFDHLAKAGAKVLLFFELTKLFGKKMQVFYFLYSVIFENKNLSLPILIKIFV